MRTRRGAARVAEAMLWQANYQQTVFVTMQVHRRLSSELTPSPEVGRAAVACRHAGGTQSRGGVRVVEREVFCKVALFCIFKYTLIIFIFCYSTIADYHLSPPPLANALGLWRFIAIVGVRIRVAVFVVGITLGGECLELVLQPQPPPVIVYQRGRQVEQGVPAREIKLAETQSQLHVLQRVLPRGESESNDGL